MLFSLTIWGILYCLLVSTDIDILWSLHFYTWSLSTGFSVFTFHIIYPLCQCIDHLELWSFIFHLSFFMLLIFWGSCYLILASLSSMSLYPFLLPLGEFMHLIFWLTNLFFSRLHLTTYALYCLICFTPFFFFLIHDCDLFLIYICSHLYSCTNVLF